MDSPFASFGYAIEARRPITVSHIPSICCREVGHTIVASVKSLLGLGRKEIVRVKPLQRFSGSLFVEWVDGSWPWPVLECLWDVERHYVVVLGLVHFLSRSLASKTRKEVGEHCFVLVFLYRPYRKVCRPDKKMSIKKEGARSLV